MLLLSFLEFSGIFCHLFITNIFFLIRAMIFSIAYSLQAFLFCLGGIFHLLFIRIILSISGRYFPLPIHYSFLFFYFSKLCSVIPSVTFDFTRLGQLHHLLHCANLSINFRSSVTNPNPVKLKVPFSYEW